MIKTETEKLLDRLLAKDLYIIWEHARTGELNDLDLLDQQVASIMLEHKDDYFSGFENPSERSLEECGPDNDIDPYMHFIFHMVIEQQLKTGDPAQVEKFFNSMLQQKVPRHEVIHLIGALLSELLYQVIIEDQEFDQQRYESLLLQCCDQSPQLILEEMEKEFKH